MPTPSNKKPNSKRLKWPKFKNPDGSVNVTAWAQSYAELERNFTQSRMSQPAPQPAPQGPQPAPQPAPQGFPMDAVMTHAAQNGGQIAPQVYQALNARGFDKSTVDSIVEGQAALAERRAQAVYDDFGGKDNYAKVREWASANFSQEEKHAFSRILNYGNPTEIKMATQAMRARYEAANGSGGSPFEGHGSSGGQPAFRSTAEMTAAMRDPRYASDPAYRNDVMQRVARMA